ncbi:MAG: transposase [Clostridia bacterium]|nr:transposase [Clostridia bacterium]
MDLPKRKKNRLDDYDYSQNGAYFITICTKSRKKILSDIVGAIHESPEIKLTPYGRILDNHISNLNARFDINIDKYVIMPDHIHLIIVITERAIRESPLRRRSLISQAIGFLKMNAARDIHNAGYNGDIWQRSYYDHIIRDKNDYNEIWEYIENNPKKWIETHKTQDA